MTDAEILMGISRAGRVRPRTSQFLSVCVRLWESGLLIICPPGERYKLSKKGREVLEEIGK